MRHVERRGGIFFVIFLPLTESTLVVQRGSIVSADTALLLFLSVRTRALVAPLGVDAPGARMAGVSSLDSLIVALVYVEALRTLVALVQRAPVTGLAATVVPAWHVEARGRMMTTVKI